MVNPLRATTQNESMMLYNEITIIDSVNGNANFLTAIFGFPLSKFTPRISLRSIAYILQLN